MKKIFAILILLCLLPISGCSRREAAQLVATTRPVYDFTAALCDGTDLSVSQLVTEKLSCLHDYTLQVSQMRKIESCQVVILSGAGLESFLGSALDRAAAVVDSSAGIDLSCADHGHDAHGEHSHEEDPHIWLSVQNARKMAANICGGLTEKYPQYEAEFSRNLQTLSIKFDELETYAQKALTGLSCRQLITFHDGFSYFADGLGLEILHSLEEESGSEASAGELKELIALVRQNQIPAIFVEENGSASAAYTVARETGIPVYALSMAMSETDYFTAMQHNIDTIKEALG